MTEGEAAQSSATTTCAAEAQSPPPDGDDASPEPSPEAPATASVEEGTDGDLSQCPICQFIEAGECKAPHQDWVACRTEAKVAGKDYIEECQDQFKAFLQCAIDNRDYYEPFLEMLGGLPEEKEGEGEGDDQQGHGKGEGGQLGKRQEGGEQQHSGQRS